MWETRLLTTEKFCVLDGGAESFNPSWKTVIIQKVQFGQTVGTTECARKRVKNIPADLYNSSGGKDKGCNPMKRRDFHSI